MIMISIRIVARFITGTNLKTVNKSEVVGHSQFHWHQVTSFMRKLHIYSALPVLALMLFFSVTGLLLNHPEFEVGEVENEMQEFALPEWAVELPNWPENFSSHSLLVLQWLDKEHGIRGVDFSTEWDEFDELLVLDLSGPNGSTVVEVFVSEQLVAVDKRKLSTVAMLNNLHRAKHVTGFWRALSDLSAICMLLFCLSGFWLVVVNRLERIPANIAMFVGTGVFVLAVYLMH